ncbi:MULTISPECIES: lipid A deacylase LpxR family protein [unclassified Hwanghaeella]|jgi:lipid A 3-O-deacylase|uniref:lipid A deacylase LpxR family protein n=1 Tax=unclassified Hwanghaeella TaxID=2605944 RepID=UPI00268FBF3D
MRTALKYWAVAGTIMAVSLCDGPSAVAQDMPDDKGTLSLMLENDLFGAGTDRHFTNGIKITYTTKEYVPLENEPVSFMARLIPFWPNGARARATYSLGQNMYTPDDISDPNLRPNDRPYAGWLYVSGGLIAVSPNADRSDAMVLELGVVGPSSGAEYTQTHWHAAFDFQEPRGWDNQIKDEPGFSLVYEHQRKWWESGVGLGMNVDVVPNAGFALGNIATYLSSGITFRLGKDLTTDLGPPRIRPSLPGSAYVREADGFNWYTFASIGGRAVARNIFLDGNTFKDSPRVDKKILVGDMQAGLAMQYDDWRLTYTYIIRSKEYKTQESIDKFGAISVSYRF